MTAQSARARLVPVLTIAVLAVAATAQSAAAQAPQSVKDRYVVVLEPGAGSPGKERAKKKARDNGADLDHDYSRALNGFAGKLSKKAVDALRADPDVQLVEPDGVVTAGVTQSSAPWGLDRIDQRARPLSGTYTYERTGTGVTAYVIDTGMRLSHSQWTGRAVSGYDAIDGGTADDCNGHGTHVAGTIGGTTYGVAKQVRLVAVRVLNCQGSGTTSGVIAGIDWVTGNHQPGQPAVANMSLGGSASTALDTAVRNSVADGVTYALAAGNESTNACNRSPARVAEGLTVGATTSSDARASYSNYGTCLDLFAPGSSIASAWHTSDSATNTISGTSMATPHVAGVAALYLQGTPSATPAAVGDAIRTAATTNVVTSPGTGSPNRLLYSLLPGTTPSPPPPTTGCGLATTYTGSLSGAGDADVHPNGAYYQSTTSGQHIGCLRGPAGTDFDLALYRWTGSSWARVAVSQTTSSNEDISYSGTPGYYYWRVYSYSGSGSYTLGVTRPS